MALSARQLTLVASTPTKTIVGGDGTGTTFKNVAGTVSDPLPLEIKNEDATAVVWVGGPDVSATKGQSLPAGQTFTANVYGTSDIPFVFSTGTPIVSVLLGRQ